MAERSTGNAVEITKINDVPVTGHQGQGSVSDLMIRRLLTLQGFYKPQDIISTMSYPGTDNTIALPNHTSSIHIGFQPLYTSDPKLASQVNARLKPSQWIKLIDRLRQIPNPVVPVRPTGAAIPASPSGG